MKKIKLADPIMTDAILCAFIDGALHAVKGTLLDDEEIAELLRAAAQYKKEVTQ